MAKIIRETARGLAVGEYASSTLTNSATETTLFSHVITAGRMGINKELNFKLVCMLTTGLVPPNLTIKVKLGSQVLAVITNQGIAGSQTNVPFLVEGVICNNNDPAVQFAFAKVEQVSGSLPMLLSASSSMAAADWSADTTSDQTFVITAQFASAASATTLTFKHATVELT